MEKGRLILYGLLIIIIGFAIGIAVNPNFNNPTSYIETQKEVVKNQPCKIYIEDNSETFMFEGLCYQYEELYNNSIRLRKLLEL